MQSIFYIIDYVNTKVSKHLISTTPCRLYNSVVTSILIRRYICYKRKEIDIRFFFRFHIRFFPGKYFSRKQNNIFGKSKRCKYFPVLQKSARIDHIKTYFQFQDYLNFRNEQTSIKIMVYYFKY